MVPTITTNEVRLVWDPLDCILRNGEIIGYVVEYAPRSSTERKRMEVTNEEFTVSDLDIDIEYTFKIAAVNNFGVGPSKMVNIVPQGMSKF